MRLRKLTLAVASCALLLPTSPAQAFGAGCLSEPTGSPWLDPKGFPGGLYVTGALGYVFPACSTTSQAVVTFADECGTTMFEHTVRGAYCGIVIDPWTTADCAWDPVGPVVSSTALVVGFDLDFDGHVSGGEPFTVPMGNNEYVVNLTGVPARLIGYPVATGPGTTYLSDQFLVQCWQ